MGCSEVSSTSVDDVMHSSDEFNNLGFRLANLAEPSPPAPVVPALPATALLAMLLAISLTAAIALRPRSGSRTG